MNMLERSAKKRTFRAVRFPALRATATSSLTPLATRRSRGTSKHARDSSLASSDENSNKAASASALRLDLDAIKGELEDAEEAVVEDDDDDDDDDDEVDLRVRPRGQRVGKRTRRFAASSRTARRSARRGEASVSRRLQALLGVGPSTGRQHVRASVSRERAKTFDIDVGSLPEPPSTLVRDSDSEGNASDESDSWFYKEKASEEAVLDEEQMDFLFAAERRRDNRQIDYRGAGKRIAQRLAKLRERGLRLSQSHLDVVHTLKLVERIWTRATEIHDGLDQDEFVDFLSAVLSLDRDGLAILFQKMDADSDGTLTWDEFLSYLLREVSHNWHFRSARGTFWVREADAVPYAVPNAVVRQMVVIPPDPLLNAPARYALSCSDNSVKVWDSDTMSFMCNLPLTEQHRPAPKRPDDLKRSLSRLAGHAGQLPVHVPELGLFRGDGAGVPTLRSLMTQHADNDALPLTESEKWQRKLQRKKLLATASVLSKPTVHLGEFTDLLPPVGDNTGRAPSAQFRKPNTKEHSAIAYSASLRQVLVAGTDRTIDFFSSSFRHFSWADQIVCPDTPQCLGLGGDLLLVGDTRGGVSAFDLHNKDLLVNVKLHGSDSVRAVSLFDNVGVVSCGLDARLVISDPEREWSAVRTLVGHTLGVTCFAHCPSYRCLVSGGFDRQVLVWDPYVKSSVGQLDAPHGRIVDVLANEAKNQIITVCADKKVRIFDVRTFKCIQSVVDTHEHKPLDELSACTFDTNNNRLVTAGSSLRLWPVEIAPGNRERAGAPAHSHLISGLCYSTTFKELVSVSIDEVVRVWDVFSGRCAFTFKAQHEHPVSAVCLDDSGKRLLTATTHGSAKMWNYNNGACMHTFETTGREITQIVYVPETGNSVVGMSMDDTFVRWPDPSTRSTPLMKVDAHGLDALSCATRGKVLVTGCSEGRVIVWSAQSGHRAARFELPASERPAGEQPLHAPGVTCVEFVEFGGGVCLLVAGTDNGDLHFVSPRTWHVVHSEYGVLPDLVMRVATNKTGTRLCAVDARDGAHVWDSSQVTAAKVVLESVKEWTPHPDAMTTGLVSVHDADAFATSSDTGAIVLWTEDGEKLATFGQCDAWPLHDPHADPDAPRESVLGKSLSVVSMENWLERETVGAGKEVPEARKRRPEFVPKTLMKAGLRTDGFQLDPMGKMREDDAHSASGLLDELDRGKTDDDLLATLKRANAAAAAAAKGKGGGKGGERRGGAGMYRAKKSRAHKKRHRGLELQAKLDKLWESSMKRSIYQRKPVASPSVTSGHEQPADEPGAGRTQRARRPSRRRKGRAGKRKKKRGVSRADRVQQRVASGGV